MVLLFTILPVFKQIVTTAIEAEKELAEEESCQLSSFGSSRRSSFNNGVGGGGGHNNNSSSSMDGPQDDSDDDGSRGMRGNSLGMLTEEEDKRRARRGEIHGRLDYQYYFITWLTLQTLMILNIPKGTNK